MIDGFINKPILESSRYIGEPDYTSAPNVSFEAGKSIVLKPGFVVERHSTFLAVIKGCEYWGIPLEVTVI